MGTDTEQVFWRMGGPRVRMISWGKFAAVLACWVFAAGCVTEELETGEQYAADHRPLVMPRATPQAQETPRPTTTQEPEAQPAAKADRALGGMDQYLLGADHPWAKRAKVRGIDWPLVKNEGPYRQYEPQTGRASFYYQPQKLATGEKFNPEDMTAAHRTLPFGTIVRCTRTDTGASVEVMINDRGPFKRGRIIDLSRGAARKLNQLKAGVVPCKIEVLAYPMIETMGPKGNG